jgi:hypothetical protein
MSNTATPSKTTTNLEKSTMTDLMTSNVATLISRKSTITDTKTTTGVAATTPQIGTSIALETTTIAETKTRGQQVNTLITAETTNTQDKDQTTAT